MSYDPPVKREVPAPKWGKITRYPTEDMRVGDSFFISLGTRRPESVTSAIYTSIRRLKAKRPQADMKFLVGRRREKGIEGVRCWRIR